MIHDLFFIFLKDFRPVRVHESTETSGKTLKKNTKRSSDPWWCTQAEFPAAEPTLPARWRGNIPDSSLIAYFAGAEATLAAAACCCMTPCCNTSRWKCYQIPPAPAASVTAAGGRKPGKSPWLFPQSPARHCLCRLCPLCFYSGGKRSAFGTKHQAVELGVRIFPSVNSSGGRDIWANRRQSRRFESLPWY